MKSLLHTLYTIFESMGRARAASALAQLGYHAQARAIMLAE